MSDSARARVNIAVFASGEGTNFARLVEAARCGALGSVDVALLVSDKPGCGAVTIAKERGIPVYAQTHKEAGGRDAFEQMAHRVMSERSIAFAVLAGYMRIVGQTLLASVPMINIHPSYLPAHKGLDAIGQALCDGSPYTGVTVHRVDASLDGGEILQQVRIPIFAGDDRATLQARIQQVEHWLLPAVVRDLVLLSEFCGR